MGESIKTRFVETVKNFAMLRKLKISGINLTDFRVFQGVYEIVKDSQFQFNLSSLDLSGSCFT